MLTLLELDGLAARQSCMTANNVSLPNVPIEKPPDKVKQTIGDQRTSLFCQTHFEVLP